MGACVQWVICYQPKKKEKKKNTVVKISDQFELHANVCFEIDFYKTKVEGANETKVLS